MVAYVAGCRLVTRHPSRASSPSYIWLLTPIVYIAPSLLLKALVGFTDGQLRAWLQGRGEAGDLFAVP